jgi:1,4-dihydroxy-6-naphthoate synthase
MQLTLGFSPCPNDTFIFDALVNGRIDTGGLSFDLKLEDVETLNGWALEGKLDLSKISYGVLPQIRDKYDLLDAGGALGKGVGPLLVAAKPLSPEQVREGLIAIPGERTTAHLLFSLAYPGVRRRKFMVFSSIEDAVLKGEADAGVIIHENRFTYQQRGLVKLADLGEYWEKVTGGPIPLGGIVYRRDLDPAVGSQVNQLIRKSLEHALSHYPVLPSFVKEQAQEMDESVMRQHIELYVNSFSLSLGSEGRLAVQTLLKTYASMHQEEATTGLSIVQ